MPFQPTKRQIGTVTIKIKGVKNPFVYKIWGSVFQVSQNRALGGIKINLDEGVVRKVMDIILDILKDGEMKLNYFHNSWDGLNYFALTSYGDVKGTQQQFLLDTLDGVEYSNTNGDTIKFKIDKTFSYVYKSAVVGSL
jgi:hypothetical protein